MYVGNRRVSKRRIGLCKKFLVLSLKTLRRLTTLKIKLVCLWGNSLAISRDILKPTPNEKQYISPQAHQNYMNNEKLSTRSDKELGIAFLAIIVVLFIAIVI